MLLLEIKNQICIHLHNYHYYNYKIIDKKIMHTHFKIL